MFWSDSVLRQVDVHYENMNNLEMTEMYMLNWRLENILHMLTMF